MGRRGGHRAVSKRLRRPAMAAERRRVNAHPRIPIATLRRQERAARGALTRALNAYGESPAQLAVARIEEAERKADIARARLDAALSQERDAA